MLSNEHFVSLYCYENQEIDGTDPGTRQGRVVSQFAVLFIFYF